MASAPDTKASAAQEKESLMIRADVSANTVLWNRRSVAALVLLTAVPLCWA